MSLADKNILLIISGGIAAYKSLDLIRQLKKNGASVRCILTKGGEQFVTPLSVAALSENQVYSDLFSLKDETEMGHIRLTREADLVIVAPASANMIAKMAHGYADDLASTTLLASNTPVLIAPAMNHVMWTSDATQTNIQTLLARGVQMIGPDVGDMACGEFGPGRMSEPQTILEAATKFFSVKPLAGLKAIVTSGPTYEPIDPVRFIGNRSSGKQGHAIAAALRDAGADVTLIAGPVSIPAPHGVKTVSVETADQMLAASLGALPADIAVCAAAVADWKTEKQLDQKMKKRADTTQPGLTLVQNPDILQTLSTHAKRPKLVVGFAAETENLVESAKSKLQAKKCDWIVGNSVHSKVGNVFGSDQNEVILITNTAQTPWPPQSKDQVARKLVEAMIEHFGRKNADGHYKHAAE